jgi:replicative DNA helicase
MQQEWKDDKMSEDIFCSPNDERALLFYAMNDINNYYSICARLDANDFLYPQHRLIFSIMGMLANDGAEKFDVAMITTKADAQGVLTSIDGIEYVQSISNMGLAQSNFEIYFNNVVEASRKHKLHSVLSENINRVINNAKDGDSSIDLISAVETNIFDMTLSGKTIDEPKNLADGLAELIESRRHNVVEMSGIPTCYPILDKQIDGMIPGTLLIVAARKKMGKSALLTNIACQVSFKSMRNLPVLYIDTEMTFGEWRDRALAIMSGVEERKIKHGGYTDEQYTQIMKALKIIERGKLFHEYMPGYSVDRLVALYKKYKIKENIGLIIFDYLKEPDSSSVDRQRKEYQILGDVTSKLKDLAGELNIPALTAVQLNRSGDVADSDRIARYGDIVAFWQTRTDQELDDGGGHQNVGTHKLVIKDTRRGGSTNEHGIGFNFWKKQIRIGEVPADRQFFNNFDGDVINADSAEGNGNELLS